MARLVIEKLDGEVHVCIESETSHEINQALREAEGSRRLSGRLFHEESDLSAFADNVHWVFSVTWGCLDDDEDDGDD